MEGKRFVYGRVMSINSNDSLPCITDSQDGKDYIKFVDVVDLLNSLNDENKELRKLIKEKVFKRCNEGSLSDLQFKAKAYDDIITIKMDYESEPKLIIYCKQGTMQDSARYARVKTFNGFIPLGVDYIIKEE